jgi:very-short-patch-repair endonuclease
MPDAEIILWSRLQRRQLLSCKFRRQYSVGSYVLDFFSPEVKLAIELDGDSHFQAGAPEYDDKRRQFIESFGICIIRFLNSEVYGNLDGVLERIGHEVLERRQKNLCAMAPGSAAPGTRRWLTAYHSRSRWLLAHRLPFAIQVVAGSLPTL